MLQSRVRELAEVFRGELRRLFDPYPAYVPDLSWPSIGAFDALCGEMYGRADWTEAEKLFVDGLVAHVAELVHGCWERFATGVEVRFQERQGIVCAAERDDGSTYRLELQRELVHTLQSARTRGVLRDEDTARDFNHPLERFALAACLGMGPAADRPSREIGPGGPVDHTHSVVRYLAQTCADHYARRFASEPLGQAAGLYLRGLIRPPVEDPVSIRDAAAALLRYMDERVDRLPEALRLLGNLARYPAAGVREAALTCLVLDERIELSDELLEVVSDGCQGRAAAYRSAVIGLAAERGRDIDWLNGGENARARFEFERKLGLLPLVRLPFEMCVGPGNRNLVEALVRMDAKLSARIIDRRLDAERPSPELLQQQAYLRLRLGDPGTSERLLQRVARSYPDRLDGRYYLDAGLGALRLGEVDRAIERLERAQVLLVWDDRLMAGLAQAYAEAGRHEDAMNLLDRAVKRGRWVANALLMRAEVHAAIGSEEGYYGDLGVAATLHPFHPRVADKVMASYLAD